MRCTKVRKILASGYLDAELNPKDRQILDKHLESCKNCSSFKEELKMLRLSFEVSYPKHPPQEIWQNIYSRLLDDKALWEKKRYSFAVDKIRMFFAFRPVFAFGVVVVFILGVSFLARRALVLKAVGEQLEILDYSLNENNKDSLFSFGTEIEEYFL